MKKLLSILLMTSLVGLSVSCSGKNTDSGKADEPKETKGGAVVESKSTEPVSKTEDIDPLQNALNVGIILSQYNEFDLEGLDDNISEKSIKQMLKNDWGITDNETTKERLDGVIWTGHREDLDVLLAIYNEVTDKATRDAVIEETFDDYYDEDIEEYQESLDFLDEVKEALGKKYAPIEFTPERLQRTTGAWDLGRAVFVARMAYIVGYLSEAEVKEIIVPIYPAVQELYPSWEEFANSYLIGRVLWKGYDVEEALEYAEMLQDLLKDSDSPWVKSPLN